MTENLAKFIKTRHDEQETNLLWTRISQDSRVEDAIQSRSRAIQSRRRPGSLLASLLSGNTPSWKGSLVWGAAAACIGLGIGLFAARQSPIHEKAPVHEQLLFGSASGADTADTQKTQGAVTALVAKKPIDSLAQEISVDLNDGSLVRLAPHSRLAMTESDENRVSLSLEAGRVECDVAKNPNRLFSVLAGSVTVRVIGTRFVVERVPNPIDEQITVFVQHGIVEVSGADGVTKRLARGETWSVNLPRAQDVKPASLVQEPGDAAPSEVKIIKAQSENDDSSKTHGTVSDAQKMFEQARAARQAGDAQTAANLYGKFLDAFAKDPRAKVAALELGRLKMDELGDLKGAIFPLSLVANSSAGGLGDDALARLVRAHAQLGQTSTCQTLRSRYLKTYPSGVHIEQVRATCPSR